jgi:hypothetical protein
MLPWKMWNLPKFTLIVILTADTFRTYYSKIIFALPLVNYLNHGTFRGIFLKGFIIILTEQIQMEHCRPRPPSPAKVTSIKSPSISVLIFDKKMCVHMIQ